MPFLQPASSLSSIHRSIEHQVGEHKFGASLAPSTIRCHRSISCRCLHCCQLTGLAPFPDSEHKPCIYVAHLSNEQLAHSTIKGCLSAVRHLNIAESHPDPFDGPCPQLYLILRGVKRTRGASSLLPRLPMTPDLRSLRRHWSSRARV